MPPMAALMAAIAQAIAQVCLTLMPTESAACWSSATARMAMPARLRRKNSVSRPNSTIEMPMAHSLLAPVDRAQDTDRCLGDERGRGQRRGAPDRADERA